MGADAPQPLEVDEPIGWLRAYTEGVEPRALPLFRRPSRVTVGAGKSCHWRFDDAGLAELEVVLAWDGVRLRVEDAARPDTRATVRHGQSIVAGATGRLRIALDLVLHDEEVTVIRKVELPPPSDETTAPVPRVPPSDGDDDARTTIIVAPPVATPPVATPPVAAPPVATPQAAEVTASHPWRVYLPPRNGAADGEPTGEWALDDALRPTADLLDRLGKRGLRTLARRAPPRRIALWGALALVVSVEAYMLVRPRHPPPPPVVHDTTAAARAAAAAADRRTRIYLPDKDLEVELHRAIAAYRAGKTAEATAALTRIVEDTNDPAARTMLFILRTRAADAQ